LAVDRRPLGAGGPSHGTTGTMVNPALKLCVGLVNGYVLSFGKSFYRRCGAIQATTTTTTTLQPIVLV